MALLEARGTLTFLLVNDVGGGFGPGNDFINAEVIMKLNSQPTQAMGFQLRDDGNRGQVARPSGHRIGCSEVQGPNPCAPDSVAAALR